MPETKAKATSPMNVYQMYVANGNKAGFWIQRDSWGYTIARVVLVQDQCEGFLDGEPPYFKSPPVIVDMFGTDGARKEMGFKLSCPGTYAYHQVEPPAWWQGGQQAGSENSCGESQ